MMEQLQWLENWLPPRKRSSARVVHPFDYEQLAAASAATAYTNAIMEMANQLENIETPEEKAQAITVTAAVLVNYLQVVQRRTGVNHDDGDEDFDDTPPEILSAWQKLAECTTQAVALASKASTRLAEVGFQLKPATLDDKPAYDEERTAHTAPEWKLINRMAETASMLGNAAALNWHFDEMNNLDSDDDAEATAGHVLALWINEDNLTSRQPQESKGDSFHEAAKAKRKSAINRMLQIENISIMEFGRPTLVTAAATTLFDAGHAESTLGNLWGKGPFSDALYQWEGDEEPFMAFRYQGSTHVKLESEPYQHSIDHATALSHCNDLKTLIDDLVADQEDDEDDDQEYSKMMHLAFINRSLILANLHDTPQDMIAHMLKLTTASGGKTTARAMVSAISNQYAEIKENLANQHGLNTNPLTEEQTKAAISAARNSGATDQSLRDMATQLGIQPHELEAYNLPAQPQVPWEEARHILEIAFCLKQQPNEDWLSAAAVLGWPSDHRNIIRLALTMDAIY